MRIYHILTNWLEHNFENIQHTYTNDLPHIGRSGIIEATEQTGGGRT